MMAAAKGISLERWMERFTAEERAGIDAHAE